MPGRRSGQSEDKVPAPEPGYRGGAIDEACVGKNGIVGSFVQSHDDITLLDVDLASHIQQVPKDRLGLQTALHRSRNASDRW